MSRIEKTIFISYRRKDISWALAVYQYLTSQKYDVFFDYTSLQSGDFEEVIVSNIRARAHFLLILTPTALDRCHEPGDWLRREIETAVDEKRNIIPMFFDGFSFGMPSVAEKLTGKLAAINRYNGLEVPPGYFLEAMERLRTRYLNIPLNAVIRPVPTQVRKVVQETQEAANKAVEEQKEDLEKLARPAEEEKASPSVKIGKKTGISPSRERTQESRKAIRPNFRYYGIGVGVLLVLTLVILGIYQKGKSTREEPTLVPSVPTQAVPETEIPLTEPPIEKTKISPSPSPTSTITPSPTLELLLGSTQVAEKDDMVQVYVPAGEFQMGSNAGDLDEQPIHTVYLDAFWIDQTEVTNAMYARCVAEGECTAPLFNKSNFHKSYYGESEYDNYPVIYVKWDDAKAYCSWVNRRLPTEAEWEKAASRWNENTQQNDPYPWGKPINCTLANYQKSSKEACISDTAEVNAYPNGASPYGALNMAGNVWEWVSDYYGSEYYNQEISWRNPTGPTSGISRVFRGGSFKSGAYEIRIASRGFDKPANALNNLGFRCALTP